MKKYLVFLVAVLGMAGSGMSQNNAIHIWQNGMEEYYAGYDSVVFTPIVRADEDGNVGKVMTIWNAGQPFSIIQPDSIKFGVALDFDQEDDPSADPDQGDVNPVDYESNYHVAEYTPSDSLFYGSMARAMIHSYKERNQSRKRAPGSNSYIKNESVSNAAGFENLSVEQYLWDSGDWGRTHFDNKFFTCLAETFEESDKQKLLVTFYCEGGFPHNVTAYLKRGQANQGKLVNGEGVEIYAGEEFGYIVVDINEHMGDYGCVNFFPVVISQWMEDGAMMGSKYRRYLNPIMIKKSNSTTGDLYHPDWTTFSSGDEIGRIDSVGVYFNCYNNMCSSHDINGVCRFQCVQLAKRYLNGTMGVTPVPHGNAADWPWKRRKEGYIVIKNQEMNNGYTTDSRGRGRYPNKIREGDILVFGGREYEGGPNLGSQHVAVVIKTAPDYISFAHQNGGLKTKPIGNTLSIDLENDTIRNRRYNLDANAVSKNHFVTHWIRPYSQNEAIEENPIADDPFFEDWIDLSTDEIRFNGVKVGETDSRPITITNTGKEPTILDAFFPSYVHVLSVDAYTQRTLQPGESVTYYIKFAPVEGDCLYQDTYLRVESSNKKICREVRVVGDACADGFSFIDLGLPSGTLWAECNLGAQTSSDSGDFYAWGETTSKSTFSWSNYKYCKGTSNTLTKYCTKSYYGYNGYTDDITELQTVDDAVQSALGEIYSIPTKEDWDELIKYCTWTWAENGAMVYGENGKHIFLPFAGYRQGMTHYDLGTEGFFWSSTLDESSPDDAWFLHVSGDKPSDYDYYRCCGRSIRPIRHSSGVGNAPSNRGDASDESSSAIQMNLRGGLVVECVSSLSCE